MNFGEIYKFDYKTNTARRYDAKPVVLVLEEGKNKLYGLNLNFVPPVFRDSIIKLVNNEMLKKQLSFEEMLMVEERTKNIDSRRLAHILFYANTSNRENMMKIMDEQQIKSERRVFDVMRNSFRIYFKSNIKTQPVKVNY
jgi:Flp pilus assembly secretin CpaC